MLFGFDQSVFGLTENVRLKLTNFPGVLKKILHQGPNEQSCQSKGTDDSISKIIDFELHITKGYTDNSSLLFSIEFSSVFTKLHRLANCTSKKISIAFYRQQHTHENQVTRILIQVAWQE